MEWKTVNVGPSCMCAEPTNGSPVENEADETRTIPFDLQSKSCWVKKCSILLSPSEHHVCSSKLDGRTNSKIDLKYSPVHINEAACCHISFREALNFDTHGLGHVDEASLAKMVHEKCPSETGSLTIHICPLSVGWQEPLRPDREEDEKEEKDNEQE